MRAISPLILSLTAAVGTATWGIAWGDQLIAPDSDNRDHLEKATYRFDTPTTGLGWLRLQWTDALGRIVNQRQIPLELMDAREISIDLDRSRAVTTMNKLAVEIELDQRRAGARPTHEHRAEATFLVTPSESPWSDYQIIMWQKQSRAGYLALKQLGVTAGMVESDHFDKPSLYVTDQIGGMLDADMRFYVENIATDFYSPYHKADPGKAVNWRFKEKKQTYWTNPQDRSAWVREPSLSDPSKLAVIRRRLTAYVTALRKFAPLYYNLGDEPGIADVSAFWDFDISPVSLAEMRDWLRGRYGDLARFNDEWGTAFQSWDDVEPLLTSDALRHADLNFAPWADYKEWMDVAFARAIRAGTDAVHIADPKALSAIEGAQIPGWGGYDYSRLATSVDALELYDYGDNVELARSFNPDAVILTTSFAEGEAEAHRIWRELLRGSSGLILWDEKREFVGPDGSLRQRGLNSAALFRRLRDGLGSLLINSHRQLDPIAILYSPASMRVQWLLDRIADGGDWSRRNASSELEDNRIRISVRNYTRALEHMGLQPHFVSPGQVERGELIAEGYRVLILPWAIALSEAAAKEIKTFLAHGGTVIAQGDIGSFDEHGRRRPAAVLSSTSGLQPSTSGERQPLRLDAPGLTDARALGQLRDIMAAAGVKPRFPVARSDGSPDYRIETYIFSNGPITILGLLRDPLEACPKTDGEVGKAAIDLGRPFEVYDLQNHRTFGRNAKLAVSVPCHRPAIFAIAEHAFAPLEISAPKSIQPGEVAAFRVTRPGASSSETDVFHIDAEDPAGNSVEYYSRNLLAPHGTASWVLPFALDDKRGVWHIRATDPMDDDMVSTDVIVGPSGSP